MVGVPSWSARGVEERRGQELGAFVSTEPNLPSTRGIRAAGVDEPVVVPAEQYAVFIIALLVVPPLVVWVRR
jgi:hypothetical protein